MPGSIDLRTQSRLIGCSEPLDRRINAVRTDIADIALAGMVFAPRYSASVTMRCTVPITAMRAEATRAAVQVSELLFGEDFAVFDRADGWAWGQATRDAYVGWVDATTLESLSDAVTHIVQVPTALRFTQASLKSPVADALPLGARVGLGERVGDYFACDDGLWIHHRHVAPPTGDAVDLAMGFVGTPYHWGGRTRSGIDCSGLVQAVLRAHGVAAPRDADQQRAAFAAVNPADRRRGDLVFVPGHVGLFVDAGHIVHANAFWMTTLVERLDTFLDRQSTREFSVARPPCERMAAPL